LDYFEEHEIPFLIGVNTFDQSQRFRLEEVRDGVGHRRERADPGVRRETGESVRSSWSRSPRRS